MLFSFRTTELSLQSDKALSQGRVGCWCDLSSFDSKRGDYTFDIFRHRGNLTKMLHPVLPEFSTNSGRCDVPPPSVLEDLDAIVIDIRDSGCRYSPETLDVMRLLSSCARMETPPSVYIVDHPNPAGRDVEGSIPSVTADPWTPKVAHRHGLTLGELCQLYCDEIEAKFPLHVISAELSPWTSDLIDKSRSDSRIVCGARLWEHTSISPAFGAPNPFEYFGAPWIDTEHATQLPVTEGMVLRPCRFVPNAGRYAGEVCGGYQILLKDGVRCHSLLYVLELMGHFAAHYSQFEISPELHDVLADPVMSEYLRGGIDLDIVQEHIKTEEQRWIRKSRRFLLYDESPLRIK